MLVQVFSTAHWMSPRNVNNLCLELRAEESAFQNIAGPFLLLLGWYFPHLPDAVHYLCQTWAGTQQKPAKPWAQHLKEKSSYGAPGLICPGKEELQHGVFFQLAQTCCLTLFSPKAAKLPGIARLRQMAITSSENRSCIQFFFSFWVEKQHLGSFNTCWGEI